MFSMRIYSFVLVILFLNLTSIPAFPGVAFSRHQPSIEELNKYNSLRDAVKINNIQSVQKLLQDHAPLNLNAVIAAPPLSIAASLGYVDMVKLLLNHKPKLDFIDTYGLTALMYASKLPDNAGLEIVKILLDKKANVNIKLPQGSIPLPLPAIRGLAESAPGERENVAAADSIIGDGDEFDITSEAGHSLDSANTELAQPTNGGPVAPADSIIGDGDIIGNVEEFDITSVGGDSLDSENTELAEPMNRGPVAPADSIIGDGDEFDINSRETLIRNSLDIYTRPLKGVGYTALFFAVENGNDVVVEALLSTKKVDVKVVDANGETALHKLPKPRVAKLLLDAGINMHATNKLGESAWYLMLSTERKAYKHLDLIQFFLEIGADAKSPFPGKHGTCPIHLAESPEVMDLLVQYGADIDAKDDSGGTLLFRFTELHHSCRFTSLELIRHAVEKHHANVNVEKFGSKTTMLVLSTWLDSYYDDKDVMYGNFGDFLISHGAKDGLSVLMSAVIKKNVKAIRSLLVAGANKDYIPETGEFSHREMSSLANPLIADLLNDPDPATFCDLEWFNAARNDEDSEEFQFPLVVEESGEDMEGGDRESYENPNIQNLRGETALFVASKSDQIDWIREKIGDLLYYSAVNPKSIKPDLNLPNPIGITPLMIAIRMGNEYVVDWLLENGVSFTDDSTIQEVVDFKYIDTTRYRADSPPWTIKKFFEERHDPRTNTMIPALIPMDFISTSGDSILLMAEKTKNYILVERYLNSVETPHVKNEKTGERFLDIACKESKLKLELFQNHLKKQVRLAYEHRCPICLNDWDEVDGNGNLANADGLSAEEIDEMQEDLGQGVQFLCRHVFHHRCIKRSNTICPGCRAPYKSDFFPKFDVTKSDLEKVRKNELKLELERKANEDVIHA